LFAEAADQEAVDERVEPLDVEVNASHRLAKVATLCLLDVDYVVAHHFHLVDPPVEDHHGFKFLDEVLRQELVEIRILFPQDRCNLLIRLLRLRRILYKVTLKPQGGVSDWMANVPNDRNPLSPIVSDERPETRTLGLQRQEEVIPIDVAAERIETKSKSSVGDLCQGIEQAPDVSVERRKVIVQWLAENSPLLAAVAGCVVCLKSIKKDRIASTEDEHVAVQERGSEQFAEGLICRQSP
jgi:hypothetical protein